MNRPSLLAIIATSALALPGCSGSDSGVADTPVARGERVYKNVCLACHAADPGRDGSLGPAVAGSSRELIEARVVRATYPDGYTPKRDSKTMPAFPHLEASIDDLAAYLNQ